MKYFALAVIAASCVGAAHAQSVGYIEGTIGETSISAVKTKIYSIPTSMGTATARGELDFERTITTGVEAGAAGFNNNTVWFGFSWDYLQTELDHGTVFATLNGVTDSERFTADEARAEGLSFDNDVHLLEAQASYNFPLIAGSFRPYLGLGAGIAAIEHAEDAELAASATAGVRYHLTKDLYLGLRARFHFISGPTDELGVEYKPITASTVSLLLGAHF